MIQMSDSPRRDLEALLDFSEAKAEFHKPEISAQPTDPYLRRIAAAALFRLPRCLKALTLLVDAGLSLEANTIARTIIELAITACWIGTDEGRAAPVWSKFVITQQEGMHRLGTHLSIMQPLDEKAWKKLRNEAGMRPDLLSCARAAKDTDDFPAQRIAVHLYNTLYDSYSADTHGDIRHILGVVWFGEADILERAVSDCVDVSAILLAAVSLQLDFRAKAENFFKQNRLLNPFGRAGSSG